MIETFVDELYRQCLLDRNDYRRRDQQFIRKNFDAYIHPFKLTAVEKEMKSELSRIVSSQIDIQTSIKQFPIGTVLRLCSYSIVMFR